MTLMANYAIKNSLISEHENEKSLEQIPYNFNDEEVCENRSQIYASRCNIIQRD